MGADLQGPFARRLQAFGSVGFGEAKDADAGAEALFWMGPAAQDDVDQGLGIGPVGGGVATDTVRGPIGVTAV